MLEQRRRSWVATAKKCVTIALVLFVVLSITARVWPSSVFILHRIPLLGGWFWPFSTEVRRFIQLDTRDGFIECRVNVDSGVGECSFYKGERLTPDDMDDRGARRLHETHVTINGIRAKEGFVEFEDGEKIFFQEVFSTEEGHLCTKDGIIRLHDGQRVVYTEGILQYNSYFEVPLRQLP